MKKYTDKELIKILKEASEAYYNTDKKIMSDEEFDGLEREYRKRFGKKYVGAEPISTKGTASISHSKYSELVGTLDKCQNLDELKEWLKKIFSKLGNKKLTLVVTLKYDGNSVAIEYKDGKIHLALTRGKNGKGVDLTKSLKDYHELEFIKDNCGIKYEVVITYENFNKLLQSGYDYANPRSTASGILQRDDTENYYEYLTFIPLWMRKEGQKITREEELDLLEEEFDEYRDYVKPYIKKITTNKYLTAYEKIEEFYNKINDKIRDKLPFMIDGIVIEILGDDNRKTLGETAEYPNWAMALKFPASEKHSVVTGFDYCLGDSGRITPRVHFEKVVFENGTEHTKQSLQNYDRYKKLNLSVGSDILVTYSNDCLSYIERLDTENNKKLDKIKKDEKILCPECGTEAVPNDTGAFIFCPNENCPGKIIGKMKNFLTKMDINGIKENMLIAFKNAGLIKDKIEDLYNMDYDKIKDIERMGPKVAVNVKNAIQTKIPYDYEILAALGIQNCSLETAKEICKVYDLKELINYWKKENNTQFISRLIKINTVAEITATYIQQGIYNNIDLIKFLLNRKYIIYKDNLIKPIKEEIIVFTGFRDKDMKEKLISKGYKVTDSISSKTTILVAKDPSKGGTKINKAKSLNIEIIDIDECKSRFNL